MGSSMDRAARSATPMVRTAWSAMPVIGIASALARNLDRAAPCVMPMVRTAWSATLTTGIVSASTRNLDQVSSGAGGFGFESGAGA